MAGGRWSGAEPGQTGRGEGSEGQLGAGAGRSGGGPSLDIFVNAVDLTELGDEQLLRGQGHSGRLDVTDTYESFTIRHMKGTEAYLCAARRASSWGHVPGRERGGRGGRGGVGVVERCRYSFPE